MLKGYKNNIGNLKSYLGDVDAQDTIEIRSNFKEAFEHNYQDKDFFYSNLSQPFELSKKIIQWKKITGIFATILVIKICLLFQNQTLFELRKGMGIKIDKISFSRKLSATENKSDIDPNKKELIDFSDTPQKNKSQHLNKETKSIKKEKFFDPMDIDSEVEINTLAHLKEEKEKIEKAKSELVNQQQSTVLAKEEINIKLKEMKKVEKSIKELLLQAEEKKKSQLGKYIKIIEGMKTKNAAVIFDKLDMDLLKEVVSVMNPRKVSMILDQMNPAKAKELLTLSMTQKIPFAP
ncbi:MAG: hypothetical protein C0432_00960 [Candidatus Puniceispirillum sp.]|nr:hypothetical protein [Candidatus Pelagibacter sp.]MBA4282852.1 hypothetical protein [Candidatus Puniceispirillum sp.]